MGPLAGRLTALCADFDAACLRSKSETRAVELRRIDDLLWSLTKEICHLIDEIGEQTLDTFRQEAFNASILKWCRLNPAIDCLWTKPAGYSGDFNTIELICQNQQAWNCFSDIFLNHLLRSEMAGATSGESSGPSGIPSQNPRIQGMSEDS
jgi:hypothetical protein